MPSKRTSKTTTEKLAESLEALAELQRRGRVAVRPGDLNRMHRERLLKNGFLREVIRGWYIPANPEEMKGESTAWYAAYWDFCAAYCNERFGNQWCLSPEQSLLLHAGNFSVPGQLLVRAPQGQNNIVRLPYDTSLMDLRSEIPQGKDIEEKNGLRLFTLPAALIAGTPTFFAQNPLEMRTALAMVGNASELLGGLLEGGHSTVAGRLAGAFRNIGRAALADEILETMRAAAYSVRENDPFQEKRVLFPTSRSLSPHVHRIRLMWQEMRKAVIDYFPKIAMRRSNPKTYLQQVDQVYVNDAYHSLSIEGYRVSRELIEKVRGGSWNPDADDLDRQHRNALAARGYYLAFQKVKASLRRVLRKENPGAVAEADHGSWYRELFAPSVTAGLLKAADLAGYRQGPVYIRQSKHVPPSAEAVRDLMPAFFELLKEEKEASVRVVLGHFIFVYIHPYADGNGRIGRFLMNVMLAAGAVPWLVIPVEKRQTYMSALEAASVERNIVPFSKFLGSLLKK
ncbi:MAG TPA: cell filamentation protein Fic [Deltaproteobacteria bacterium]|nr:cell filamentation protein Fic [Deltaproteobacteria bacterium]